jgi:hypothetical protein
MTDNIIGCFQIEPSLKRGTVTLDLIILDGKHMVFVIHIWIVHTISVERQASSTRKPLKLFSAAKNILFPSNNLDGEFCVKTGPFASTYAICSRYGSFLAYSSVFLRLLRVSCSQAFFAALAAFSRDVRNNKLFTYLCDLLYPMLINHLA